MIEVDVVEDEELPVAVAEIVAVVVEHEAEQLARKVARRSSLSHGSVTRESSLPVERKTCWLP